VTPSWPHVGSYRGGYLRRSAAPSSGRCGGDFLALATTTPRTRIDISGLTRSSSPGARSRASIWQRSGRAGRAGADGVAVFIASTTAGHLPRPPPEAIFGSPSRPHFRPRQPVTCSPPTLRRRRGAAPHHRGPAPLGLPTTRARRPRGTRPPPRQADGWYRNIHLAVSPSSLTDLRGSGGGELQVVESLDRCRAGHRWVATAPRRPSPAPSTCTVAASTCGGPGGRRRPRPAREPRYRTGTIRLTLRILGTERTRNGPATPAESLGLRAVEGTARWRATTASSHPREGSATCPRPPGANPPHQGGLVVPSRRWRAGRWASTRTSCPAPPTPRARCIGLLPAAGHCDRWDIGGLSTANHPDTGPHVFVTTGHPAGRASPSAAGVAAAWLDATLAAIEAAGAPTAVRHGTSPPSAERNARCPAGPDPPAPPRPREGEPVTDPFYATPPSRRVAPGPGGVRTDTRGTVLWAEDADGVAGRSGPASSPRRHTRVPPHRHTHESEAARVSAAPRLGARAARGPARSARRRACLRGGARTALPPSGRPCAAPRPLAPPRSAGSHPPSTCDRRPRPPDPQVRRRSGRTTPGRAVHPDHVLSGRAP
jgi:hypothetical protein